MDLKFEPDVIPNFIQSSPKDDFGPNLIRLQVTNQIKELQTVIRDRNTCRSDFRFYADRLIRMIVEEGLNQLPYQKHVVTAPTGCQYEGLRFEEGNCGVSIIRSGEAMEKGLRECCRSICIGKILITSNEETQQAKVLYANLPVDIAKRKVLLMSPILRTGDSIVKAIEVLLNNHVQEKKIVVLTVFTTPQGVKFVLNRFPEVRVVTSEVDQSAPTHFGHHYFGTD